MKITILLPALEGTGGIQVAYRYAQYFKNNGHEVTAYAPINAYNLHRSNTLRDILQKIYACLKNIKWCYFDKLADKITRENGIASKYVFQLDDDNLPDADIVIATAWPTAFDAAKLSPSKGKKIYLVQDYEIWDNEMLGKKSYELPLRKVVIAEWIRKRISKECRVNPNEMYIVNNGIDTSFYNNKNKCYEHKKIKCLMLYHELPKKGFDSGVKAFTEASNKNKDLELTVFGIKKWNECPKNIVDVVNPTKELILELYRNSDIFIFPSLEEGWGLTVIEAMACKCAVIGTNVGCMIDIGRDGENSLVTLPNDIHGMANNILKVASNTNLRKKLSENGCKTVQKLNWERSGKRLEEILKEELK